MPKEQRTFMKEFKQEAVRLAQTSGKSITQVARDLGIADSTLHHWCKLQAEQWLRFIGALTRKVFAMGSVKRTRQRNHSSILACVFPAMRV
jgi:transposase-like protein